MVRIDVVVLERGVEMEGVKERKKDVRIKKKNKEGNERANEGRTNRTGDRCR